LCHLERGREISLRDSSTSVGMTVNKYKKLIIISTLSVVVLIALAALIYINFQNKQPGKCDPKKHIARINDICILKETYQKMLDRANQISKTSVSRSASPSTSVSTPDQVLDQVIDLELISHYAEQNKIEVKDSEVNDKYQLAVKSVGTEQEYLEKLKTLQGIDKNQVFELIKIDILKDKVRKSLQTPLESWLNQQKHQAKIEKL
jgi:hypothetical protein